jgi:hypothetical protein
MPIRACSHKGQQDRGSWEQWFNNLQGDYKTGAFFWASQRSLPKPGSCSQMNSDFYAGCTAAKTRLASTDVLRKSEPDYKAGWNTWTVNPMPQAVTQDEGQKVDPTTCPGSVVMRSDGYHCTGAAISITPPNPRAFASERDECSGAKVWQSDGYHCASAINPTSTTNPNVTEEERLDTAMTNFNSCIRQFPPPRFVDYDEAGNIRKANEVFRSCAFQKAEYCTSMHWSDQMCHEALTIQLVGLFENSIGVPVTNTEDGLMAKIERRLRLFPSATRWVTQHLSEM